MLYSPSSQAYQRAKSIFGEMITIENSLNILYLKCPLGDDDFVKNHLSRKLQELGKITKNLSEMPYLHEAWTLLRYCGADARVTHLQRVIPPSPDDLVQ